MSFVAGAITATLELAHLQFDQAILNAINETKRFQSETGNLSAHLDATGKSANSSGFSVQNFAKQLAAGSNDSGALRAALESLGAGADEAAGAVGSFGAAVGIATAAAAAAIYSIYELGKGIKNVVSETVGLQSHTYELAETVGVGTAEFSRFAFAASLMGVNADEAAESFRFLGKNVYDATNGNQDAIATFRKYGITFEDAAGHARPLADVMLDVSDALHAAAPGAERTGAAMSLLSARSTGMVTTLAQGSAALRQQMGLADEFGVTVDESTGKAAHGFDMLLNEVQAAWTGIKSMLGKELVIALTPELESLVNWIRTHGDEIRTIVQGIASVAVEAVKIVSTALEGLANLLDTRFGRAEFGAIVGGALLGPVGAIGGFASGLTSDDPRPSTTINVQPIDASASFNQITAATQHGLRQQRDQFRSDQDLAARRMNIENGI